MTLKVRQKYWHNVKKKKIAFDIDGVVCKTSSQDYSKSEPYPEAINKINSLYEAGHKIILFTARYMGRTNNNTEKAYEMGYELTKNQLLNWGLKFDKLIMGKPDFDILIDDKAYNYDDTFLDTWLIQK